MSVLAIVYGLMILTCPNCATRYVIPDTAIGAEGRQVRCANCKHSWFQEAAEFKTGPIKIQDVETPPVNIAPKSIQEQAIRQNEMMDQKTAQSHSGVTDDHITAAATSGPIAQTTAHNKTGNLNSESGDSSAGPAITSQRDTSSDTSGPDTSGPDGSLHIAEGSKTPSKSNTINDSENLFSNMDQKPAFMNERSAPKEQNEYAQALASPPPAPFDHQPPFKPRRNPAKLWTIAAIIFAFVIGVAAMATWYSGALDGSLSSNSTSSRLEVTVNSNEMNETSDGRRFFVASGTIINPTSETLDIPDMIATLMDDDDREIYSWEIPAPADALAPGAKIEFSGAARDNVPRAATVVAVAWKETP